MSPEVREQLERILASELFRTAGRHSRLLRYLVERTAAGEGDQLKEYVLATEVFDRSEAYDPRLDSIVRVEARRLRNRLQDYYRGAGAGDPLVISIPRGSYVPTFTYASPADAGPSSGSEPPMPLPAPAAPPRAGALRAAGVPAHPGLAVRGLTVLGLAAAAILALVLALLLKVDRSPAAEASPRPSVAVLPFAHYSPGDGAQDARFAAYVTDSLTTALARLGTVSVVSRTSASRYAGRGGSAVEIAKALDVRFVLESTVALAGEDLEVVVRLVDGRRDRKVWVGEYRTTRREFPALARTIAQEVSAAAHQHVNE